MAFNWLIDVRLKELLQQASRVGTLNLKGNGMEFDPESKGVNLLSSKGGDLHHLNMSYNAFTRRSFVYFFWKVGGSFLET